MKKISLTIIFVFVIGCQKEKSIIAPKDNTSSVNITFDSISVDVFGIVNTDTIYAIPSVINIDSINGFLNGLFTQGDGRYLLLNKSKGKHHIYIEHPFFYTFDSIMDITSKTIAINLIPKVSDFLPLKVGNNWVYQFMTNSYDHGIPPRRRTSGIISVTVDSVTSSPGPYYIQKNWYIKQIEIDTLYYVDNPSIPPDSLRYTNVERHYFIIEDNNHDTRSSISNNVYDAFIFYNNLYFYPRYRISDSLGNIEDHNNKYTKNIGFIESHVTSSDPNYGTYYERQYWLISSNLK